MCYDSRMDDDRLHGQIERARVKVRLEQRCIELHAQGVTVESIAGQLGVSESTVHRLRAWLGLASGRGHRGGAVPTLGRMDSTRRIRRLEP